MRAKLEAERR